MPNRDYLDRTAIELHLKSHSIFDPAYTSEIIYGDFYPCQFKNMKLQARLKGITEYIDSKATGSILPQNVLCALLLLKILSLMSYFRINNKRLKYKQKEGKMLIWCCVLLFLGIAAFLDSLFTFGEIFRRVNSVLFMLVSLGLLIRTSAKIRTAKREGLQYRIKQLEDQIAQLSKKEKVEVR